MSNLFLNKYELAAETGVSTWELDALLSMLPEGFGVTSIERVVAAGVATVFVHERRRENEPTVRDNLRMSSRSQPEE